MVRVSMFSKNVVVVTSDHRQNCVKQMKPHLVYSPIKLSLTATDYRYKAHSSVSRLKEKHETIRTYC
jgi:hypothetical protein